MTISAPANCQVGDILIAWILARGTSSSITTLSGWNLIGSPAKVGSLTFKLFWHVWGTGETSYSWTMAGGYYSAGIIAWRGVNNTSPIGASNYASGTTGTTVTVTTINAAAPNSMIDFRMGDYYTSNRTFASETLNSVAMTEQYDMGNNRNGNAGSYKSQAASGATGSGVGTISGSITEWAGGMVSLTPAVRELSGVAAGDTVASEPAVNCNINLSGAAAADSTVSSPTLSLLKRIAGLASLDTSTPNITLDSSFLLSGTAALSSVTSAPSLLMLRLLSASASMDTSIPATTLNVLRQLAASASINTATSAAVLNMLRSLTASVLIDTATSVPNITGTSDDSDPWIGRPGATTFAELIAAPASEKVFLAEIRVSEQVMNWTKTVGCANVYQKSYLTDTITLVGGTTDIIRKVVDGVKQNSIAYTAKTSAAEVDANASSYWHDTTNGILYIHTSTGVAPGSFTIMASFWLYFATKGIDLNGRYYEPVLAENSIPRISQEVQSLRYGVVTVGSGGIVLTNGNGYFDQISKKYVWVNGIVKLLLGGDSLPYSEYAALFQGRITSPNLTNLEYSLDVNSISYDLLRSLPVNGFWTSTYPYLDPAAQGKEIPLYYGIYDASQAPVVNCIDMAYATDTYQFKICDTSFWPIKAISQVYVDYGDGAGWQTIAHANESLADATFTITSTAFIVGTSRVKVAFEGYHNGGTLIEGAPEIAEDLLTTWCGLAAADLDSASFTASKTRSTCNLNVPIESTTSALTIIEQICRSDLAYFSDNAAGQLRYTTWMPQPGSSVSDSITSADIWDVGFEDDVPSLYWKSRVGYSFQCADQSYLYSTSSDVESKYKYGREETLTLDTYLRGSADSDSLAARMNLLTKDLLTVMDYTMSIAKINALVGDRVNLTFVRAPYPASGGQVGCPYEIISKEISAFPAQVTFRARDMATYGKNIGFWTADGVPAWLAATEDEQRSAGYWCDGSGYADSSATPDETSKNVSLWW